MYPLSTSLTTSLPLVLQRPLLPPPLLYGYDDSVARPPNFFTYWKAESMMPPLHPAAPFTWQHETICCSEKETSLPVEIWWTPSMEPVALNVQHEPHWPWFFTGVTAPFLRQSTVPEEGLRRSLRGSGSGRSALFLRRASQPSRSSTLSWNSDDVMSENWLMAWNHVSVPAS